ncbi:MAG: 50S ribosomal protein L22 [Candidatus Hydrothermarchaeota archaeon]
MPEIGYPFEIEEEARVAKATGRELRVSPKFSFEICREIKGKNLEAAKRFLEDVMAMKRPVPLKRYKKGVAHSRGLEKACAGRYPVKAASKVLEVLQSAEANAEYKGLSKEKLYIKEMAVLKGRILRGSLARAFGRATPHNTPTSNIQVVLAEK